MFPPSVGRVVVKDGIGEDCAASQPGPLELVPPSRIAADSTIADRPVYGCARNSSSVRTS